MHVTGAFKELNSLNGKIKRRKKQLSELLETIEALEEFCRKNPTLMKQTDLALARADKANLVITISTLERKRDELQAQINKAYAESGEPNGPGNF